MSKRTIPLPLTSLLLAAHVASAQTAPIAHRSHGKPVSTCRSGSAAHQPGDSIQYVPVRIVYLEGAQAVQYSQAWRGGRASGRIRVDTVDVRQLTRRYFPDSVLLELRRRYPKAQLIGFQSRKLRETWPSID